MLPPTHTRIAPLISSVCGNLTSPSSLKTSSGSRAARRPSRLGEPADGRPQEARGRAGGACHRSRTTALCAGRKKRQSPDEYLRIVAGSEPARSPLLEDARRDLSVVAPETFAAVVQAIRKEIGVQLVYRSMNHPTGTDRLVFPHALVRVPRRWHMRAWCTERRDFRDFTLGRVANVRLVELPAPARRSDDKDWNEITTVTIVAHPGLTADQQSMIAAEYFPGASARQLSDIAGARKGNWYYVPIPQKQ